MTTRTALTVGYQLGGSGSRFFFVDIGGDREYVRQWLTSNLVHAPVLLLRVGFGVDR